jgi:hypothetical protein
LRQFCKWVMGEGDVIQGFGEKGEKKSVFVAYLIWFVCGFGVLGLHHLYLGDDRKAFLWASSLGGFGLGSARDFFLLPRYCRDKVEDAERRKSFPLLGGTFLLSYYFSRVAVLAFCNRLLLDPSNPWNAVVVRALVCGVVSHLCLCSGNRRNTISIFSIAAVSGLLQSVVVLLPPLDEFRAATFIPGVQTVAAFAAAAFAYRFRSFQKFWNRTQTNIVVRIIRLVLALILVLVLLSMAFYFNARISVTVQNGDESTRKYIYLCDVDWQNDVSVERFKEYLIQFLMEFEEVKRFSAQQIDEEGAYEVLSLKVINQLIN